MTDHEALLCVAVAAQDVALAHQRPSVLYRPSLYPDGDQWCALYGANLQEGVAGFGDTPAAAMAAFDVAWQSAPSAPVARKALEDAP